MRSIKGGFYHEKIIKVKYIAKGKYEEKSSEYKDTLKYTWKEDTGELNESN